MTFVFSRIGFEIYPIILENLPSEFFKLTFTLENSEKFSLEIHPQNRKTDVSQNWKPEMHLFQIDLKLMIPKLQESKQECKK